MADPPRSMTTSRLTTFAIKDILVSVSNGAAALSTPVELLASTPTTVAGEPLYYPQNGQARITAAIVTLQPGEETGWHTHPVPALGYVLEGELSVDYGTQGRHTYGPGRCIIEAMALAHNGYNAGDKPMRILAVFIGADGIANTEPSPLPVNIVPNIAP